MVRQRETLVCAVNAQDTLDLWEVVDSKLCMELWQDDCKETMFVFTPETAQKMRDMLDDWITKVSNRK